MKTYNTFIKSIRTIAFTGLWLVPFATVQAQEAGVDKHQLAVTVGGVASTLDYDMPMLDSKDSQGFNLGLEYTYFFSQNFGVSLGAEYQHFSATATVEDGTISGAYGTMDNEGEAFEFRYAMTNIKEEQKLNYVNIPVMLVYQNNEYGFYIRGGAKIGVPVASKFSGSYDASTSGYYEQYNAELYDPEFMGFGDFEDVKTSGDKVDTKINYIATVELGLKQPFSFGTLYGGLYFDYGLNNIAKGGKDPIVYTTTDEGATFTNNSIVNSDYTKSLKTMAFGIKLRFSFWNF